MAELNQEIIKYLAELSRIAVSPDEEESLLKDLKKILHYVEQLNEVDTSGLKPCTYVTLNASQTPLRDDLVVPTLSREQFLKGAPEQIAGMVRVPPVIKQEG
jgi:aspartyl-tRNA(Asn)/glutamyl-tRNA(Gln) amidotransferase subunit C